MLIDKNAIILLFPLLCIHHSNWIRVNREAVKRNFMLKHSPQIIESGKLKKKNIPYSSICLFSQFTRLKVHAIKKVVERGWWVRLVIHM